MVEQCTVSSGGVLCASAVCDPAVYCVVVWCTVC